MNHQGKGFTLIELIVVVVLLSVLSALGVGLFSAPSQYHAANALESWLNLFQYSQRQSLLKQSLTSPLVLSVTRTSENWVFSLNQGPTQIDTFSIAHQNKPLRVSTSQWLTTCGSLSELTYPLEVRFNGAGNRIDATGQVVSQNLRLCFDDTHQMCLSPSGFAYAGICVP